MVCIEKCLHFKRKCRHHPHPILDILPVYLTRGISIAGGLLFRTSPFLRWEKLRCTQQAKAHKKVSESACLAGSKTCGFYSNSQSLV